MKLQIKYYYEQQYLPTKRHRNIRTVELESQCTVTTKELTAEEFPVAFVIHDMQTVCFGMKSYSDYDNVPNKFQMHSEEIRTYHGKLYKPVRVTHGAAISTVFENETYVTNNLESLYRKHWWNNDLLTEDAVLLENNKAERRRELQKYARRYLHFDGKFWAECSEPRYEICTFGLGHNHGGTGFFIEYHYNPNISKNNYFSALQREEAIAYGKSVAAGRGDTDSIDRIGKYDNIEVLMPEMVKVRPSKQHGNGDPFLNKLENLIQGSDDALTAGLLVMAATVQPN